MLSKLLKKESLFCILYKIDKKVAEQYQAKPCPHCGGPLHFANYLRKPRGGPDDIPEKYLLQFSLCCGAKGCRRRVKVPSCRFNGRKVYWHAFILIIVSERQQPKHSDINIFKLSKLFNVSRNTITRWLHYYKEEFPFSREWKRIRGQVIASLKNDELPSNLINYFLNLKASGQEALVSCLKFLSRGSDFYWKIREE
jgi:hypothetical protein